MKTQTRPANYYASGISIPDYVEKAILSLSLGEKLRFAQDLITAMRGDDSVFLANTNEALWLQSQPFDSLLSVLKWVTSELL
jgi:hypothetical protein